MHVRAPINLYNTLGAAFQSIKVRQKHTKSKKKTKKKNKRKKKKKKTGMNDDKDEDDDDGDDDAGGDGDGDGGRGDGCLYAAVSLHSNNEMVRLNFGQEPFHFDIHTYMRVRNVQ